MCLRNRARKGTSQYTGVFSRCFDGMLFGSAEVTDTSCCFKFISEEVVRSFCYQALCVRLALRFVKPYIDCAICGPSFGAHYAAPVRAIFCPEIRAFTGFGARFLQPFPKSLVTVKSLQTQKWPFIAV